MHVCAENNKTQLALGSLEVYGTLYLMGVKNVPPGQRGALCHTIKMETIKGNLNVPFQKEEEKMKDAIKLTWLEKRALHVCVCVVVRMSVCVCTCVYAHIGLLADLLSL